MNTMSDRQVEIIAEQYLMHLKKYSSFLYMTFEAYILAVQSFDKKERFRTDRLDYKEYNQPILLKEKSYVSR